MPILPAQVRLNSALLMPEVGRRVEPVARLAMLIVATSGLYALGWYYKQWHTIKRHKKDRSRPIVLTLLMFVPVVNFCLFYRLFSLLDEVVRRSPAVKTVPPIILAGACIVLNALVITCASEFSLAQDFNFKLYALSSLLFLSAMATWPLIVAQRQLNGAGANLDLGDEARSRFSTMERLLVLAGVLCTVWHLWSVFASD